MRLRR
jgi:hypothetical protein